MSYGHQKLLRIGLFLLAVLLPLFTLLLPPTQPGITFWWDFAIALGFCAAVLIGLMFLLTARLRYLSRPFGIDLIYYFHRQLALIILLLIIAHPAILLVTEPLLLEYLKPSAPWAMNAGVLALLVFVALVLGALLHKYLRYEYWRWSHALLAVVGMLLMVQHMIGVGYYVAPGWKQGLLILFTCGWLVLLVMVRFVFPNRLRRHPWRLTHLQQERGNAWSLTLEPEDNLPLHFEPGQFAWLSIRSSPFALREHPFSIASGIMEGATDSRQVRFTIKELGDCTRQIKTLPLGEKIYLDGPYGAFTIDRFPDAGAYVFIAGGIGIVPMMSMLRTMAARQDMRPVILIYAYRSVESLTFHDELLEMQQQLKLQLVFVLRQPPSNWQGEQGCITPALLKSYLTDLDDSTEYFICGPNSMMTMVERSLHQQGVRFANIHVEIFHLL